MHQLLRLLPNTLVGRVFALYFATLLFFVSLGLGLFYRYQFSQVIDDTYLTAEMMMDVAAPNVADSAVIGDYDTIKKTLERSISKSHFSQAVFIDAAGTSIKAENLTPVSVATPLWFQNIVANSLFDINRNIAVGGKDYGVMRLKFDYLHIASDLWRLLLWAMALGFGAFLGGVLLIRIPLKRWLGNFDRVRSNEQQILSGSVEVASFLDDDAPEEVKQVFDILSRAAARIDAQRVEASVTLNAITDGVLTINPERFIVYCNPAALQILALTSQEILGKSLQAIFPQAFDAHELYGNENSHRFEINLSDQRSLILDTTMSDISSVDGKPLGQVIAFRDVTQAHALNLRLRNELQIRERALNSLRGVLQVYQSTPQTDSTTSTEADLEQLSNQLLALVRERENSRRSLDNQKFALDQHAIVSITDLNGTITYANDLFCEISGFSRQELIGNSHKIVNSGHHPAEFFTELWRTIQSGQVWHKEIKNRNKSGQYYWVDATIVPLSNTQGQLEQYIAIRTDITERKAFEERLQEARAAAESASMAKSDFLANMSHEIRTPMNGVIGMTELVLDSKLDPTQRDHLNIVKSSAQALLVILNDILDFSKIEAGKLSIEHISFSVTATVQETLKSLTARSDKKGLKLVSELDPNLSGNSLGDPGRIRQILNNLCDNAIKFTATGSITVRVFKVSSEAASEMIQFSVSDTGLGIAEDKQSSIFEAFSQADTSTTRNFGGTGLGLTICSRLVNLMGGNIWLESAPGQGSTFHFTVCLGRPQSTLNSITGAASDSMSVPVQQHTGPLVVLLVEDHPINQLLATSLLNRWGHQVVLAQNGQEALNIFPSQHWDIVLMDMQMPVMGGLQATRLIRALESPGQHTPIVAMTANAMESDRNACLVAGMDDHLSKPINPESLKEILTRFNISGSKNNQAA